MKESAAKQSFVTLVWFSPKSGLQASQALKH